MKNPIRPSCLSAVLVVAGAAFTPPAAEAQPQRIFASVKVGGTLITGNCNGGFSQVGGRDVGELAIVLQAGASASAVSGRFTLRPYRIVRPVDPCSLPFFEALVQSKVVTAEIFFFQPDPFEGLDRHYYTVKLEDARVVAITSATNALATSPQELAHATKEIISLSFDTMTLTDVIHSREVVVAAPPR